MSRKEPHDVELRYRSSMATPHPQLYFVPPGSSVSEIVAAATHDPELHARVIVRIDGDEIRPEWWSRFRPHPQSRIEITLLPACSKDAET